jgi:hypothetical protein
MAAAACMQDALLPVNVQKGAEPPTLLLHILHICTFWIACTHLSPASPAALVA